MAVTLLTASSAQGETLALSAKSRIQYRQWPLHRSMALWGPPKAAA